MSWDFLYNADQIRHWQILSFQKIVHMAQAAAMLCQCLTILPVSLFTQRVTTPTVEDHLLKYTFLT